MKRKDPLEYWLERTGKEARRQAREREQSFLSAFHARQAMDNKGRRRALGGGGLSFPRPRLALAGAFAAILLAAGMTFLFLGDREAPGLVAHESGGITMTGPGASSGTLSPGTTLGTHPGGCALASLDGGRVMVYLDGDSSLTVADSSTVRLEGGSAWFSVRSNSGRFDVALPSGTVTVQGTSFAITTEGGESSVYLARGRVSVQAGSASHPISPDEMVTLGNDGKAMITNFEGLDEPPWVTRLYNGYQLTYNKAYFPSSAP